MDPACGTGRLKPKVVYFDAVGTLIFPHPPVGEVYARQAQRHGATLDPVEAARRFQAAFRREEERDRAAGWWTSEQRERERWASIVGETFQDQLQPLAPLEDLWQHFARPDAWACYPDVASCLDGLVAHGCRLGIASNFDSRLRSIAAGIPALRPCTSLVISSEAGSRKPGRQFFDALLREADVPLEDLLFVGDHPENDYDGGRAAGLRVMLVDRAGGSNHPAAIRSLAELPRWLTGGLHGIEP